MDKSKQFQNLKYKDAYIFISVGVILILASILLHTLHLINTTNEFWLFANELTVQFFSHIGIGCLAIGIITIVIDMGHWTSYFETRLSKIVTEKQYLEKLDTASLINLQTEVLKAYFKNDEIGGSDGFLTFYQKNIQNIVGMPFRTNVQMNLKIDYESDDRSKLKIIEILSYTCLANSGRIQKNVCYLPEKDEQFEIIDFEVILRHDSLKDSNNRSGAIHFDANKLNELNACKPDTDGFDLNIEEYNYNALNVVVKVHYIFDLNRFFSWRMSHPSRNVTVNISFPKDLSLKKEFFFNENASHTEKLDDENGSYFLCVQDWLMPDEGLALQLYPVPPAQGIHDILKEAHVTIEENSATI